jgi:hypothetical protein
VSTTITDRTWKLLQERLEALLAEAKAGRFGLFWIACPGIDCWHCTTRRCEAQLDLALFDDDGICRCPHGHDIQITKDQMRVDRSWAPLFPSELDPEDSR